MSRQGGLSTAYYLNWQMLSLAAPPGRTEAAKTAILEYPASGFFYLLQTTLCRVSCLSSKRTPLYRCLFRKFLSQKGSCYAIQLHTSQESITARYALTLSFAASSLNCSK